ncbi:geraniol 8-hydroxylase [Ziziphus jujuba]|uniref:Geraniol 8-hydroxylase n=1 Tax=Ziziphus jujuba TaxID=326968 RepID=A0A6P4ATK5_ZIZJJ|nr:geraniol 8-hydroxylase [Ziziphus jujuba]
MGHSPHKSLAKMAKIHGPLMTIQLGFNTTVVASSVEMARELLIKNDQAFLGRPIPQAVTAQEDYQDAMAWLSGGPKWRSLRKLCNTQIFTTQRLEALQDFRRQMMEGMIMRVTEASEAGESINIGRLVFGTSLNLLSNNMFSVDIIDPKSNVIKELKELIGRIMVLAGKPNLTDCFPFLRPFDPQGIKKETKVSYDRLHSMIDMIIDKRLSRRASGLPGYGDFLDILLDNSQEHGSRELSRSDIKTLLTDLFLGGTDTSSTTVEWAMTELLKNPKMMQKLKQELAETIGQGQSMEEKYISKLPYLQAVLKETMRLHPAAPLLLPHQAQMDVEVCGYNIPEGTQVFVNSWAISRDPMYWPDRPTEFVPERFLVSNVEFRGTDLSYTPFGAGRRICPGLSLAVRMLSMSLGSLVHLFDWKLPNGMEPEDIDMDDKFGITLQKAIPLIAIPVAVS